MKQGVRGFSLPLLSLLKHGFPLLLLSFRVTHRYVCTSRPTDPPDSTNDGDANSLARP